MVKLHFIGYLKEKAGAKVIEVELKKPVTFEELVERYLSDDVKSLIKEKYMGFEADDIIIVISGESLDLKGGTKAVIKNEDELFFLPNISGG